MMHVSDTAIDTELRAEGVMTSALRGFPFLLLTLPSTNFYPFFLTQRQSAGSDV